MAKESEMSTTQPIKDIQELKKFKGYYQNEKPNIRNYVIIQLGINTALRISDLLQLRWGDVYDFKSEAYKTHIVIKEQKTGKNNRILLNTNAKRVLQTYRETFQGVKKDMYLFPGRKRNRPLSRFQAFRVVKSAALALHLDGNIGCHSLRKTFGYHAWKSGAQPVLLMSIYNHSSYHITKRYLDIDQDDKDYIFLTINL